MRALVGLGPNDDQALATNLSGGMKRKLQMGG
jgi:ABC-type multidrug transport system ATPase subunit